MGGSDLPQRIERLLAPSLAAMGFEIVRVQLAAGGRLTLQIMVERNDGAPVSLVDCTAISRAASALLDVEDPVAGSYTLEVSSPGIDRPLVRAKDFERFAGFEVKAETAAAIDGRRRFRGELLGLAAGKVRIALEGAVVELPFDAIHKAKLVLNEKLLAAQGAEAQRTKAQGTKAQGTKAQGTKAGAARERQG